MADDEDNEFYYDINNSIKVGRKRCTCGSVEFVKEYCFIDVPANRKCKKCGRIDEYHNDYY